MDEIKRKIRKLKKCETKIRFGGYFNASNLDSSLSGKLGNLPLVWAEYFDIDRKNQSKAKYSLEDLLCMSKEEYKKIIDEFFFSVYYKYYTENGITGSRLYDPEALRWMGLLPDASSEDIKRKFRELAKKYHPDTGGDETGFIKLMENYQKLL